MPGERAFVDSNIVVYAHDTSAGVKRYRARALISELWESGGGCVSVQVLQEFFVNVTRKVPEPLDADTAAEVIADLSFWHVHAPTSRDVLAAIQLHREAEISFWDAMILRSAVQEGCATVYSEDLNAGQNYAGVRVQNPLVTD